MWYEKSPKRVFAHSGHTVRWLDKKKKKEVRKIARMWAWYLFASINNIIPFFVSFCLDSFRMMTDLPYPKQIDDRESLEKIVTDKVI